MPGFFSAGGMLKLLTMVASCHHFAVIICSCVVGDCVVEFFSFRADFDRIRVSDFDDTFRRWAC